MNHFNYHSLSPDGNCICSNGLARNSGFGNSSYKMMLAWEKNFKDLQGQLLDLFKTFFSDCPQRCIYVVDYILIFIRFRNAFPQPRAKTERG